MSAVVVPRLWDYTKLKTWREDAGLRRERVAADNDITVSWLVQIEHGTTGQRQVGMDTVIQLCRYFGHDVAELILPEPVKAAS